MKNLRQLCAGLILMLVLTSTVFAGQMDCPGITQEPPPPSNAMAGDMPNGVTGDIQNGVQSTDTEATTQTVLTLLLVALSVV
jgi:hypothetical protein